VLVVAVLAILALGFCNATARPIVRELVLTIPDYPSTAPPLRLVLLSDAHVHGPDMPPSRLGRIVDQINALHPDIDVAAGDFIGNNRVGRSYSIEQAVAPLAGLRARYGVFAVLGNNDYHAGADDVASALERSGIRVLRNDAARAGPLAIGGMDGKLYSHAGFVRARKATAAAMERTPGVKVLVVHRPDEFAFVADPVELVLAGHTHCGQIVLPIVGPLETGSDFGRRFLCGIYRKDGKVLIVTAGLGTSYVPLRFGAPPDIWLITLRRPPSQR
jgi:predicted MPP superfamily phosphohydrolase